MHKARFVASRKTERHYCKETRLKRYCKNIDITDRNFIEKAVFKCLDTRMDRRDTMKLLSEYINIPYPDIKRIAEKIILSEILKWSDTDINRWHTSGDT